MQVDGKQDKKKYSYSHYSRSKEHKHQANCVKSLVTEKVFTLGKFGIRSSDYAESHGGIINTRAVNVKCFRRWLIRGCDKGLIFNEINTLRIFYHPNISRVIRTNILTDGVTMPEYPYIMTEYAEFGTLGDFLADRYVDKTTHRSKERAMPDWQLLLRMLIQLVSTMKYLHEVHHLMHNDIHCGNVLVVRDSLRNELDEANVLIKLGDFTNARASDCKEHCALKPIPSHRALEIWQGEPYDVAADVFSCGQTIAQVILVKQKSFNSNYSLDDVAAVTGDAIANGILPPISKEKSAIGLELSDIVKECWVECGDRPDLEDIETKLVNMEMRYFPSSIGKAQVLGSS